MSTENLSIASLSNFDQWCIVYFDNLRKNIVDHPDEYGFELTEDRMARFRKSFRAGTFDKNGRTCRQCCNHFELNFTYKAIHAFLAG